LLQGTGGVVGRHHHHDLLALQHLCANHLINVFLSEVKNLRLLLKQRENGWRCFASLNRTRPAVN
ncbi:MAG: hypothetical protein ACREIW_15570, partial [Chthoniobacterales bacterium]